MWIGFNDFQWCEGLEEFLRVTKNGELEVSGLLAVQMRRLPPQFLRIHKSYAVNLAHVTSIRRFKATLQSGTELPISKEKYMQLKKALANI